MKDFKLIWSILIISLFVFCLSIQLTICSSIWWIILLLLSLCWIVEMIIYNIKWCDTLKEKERIKAAKILYTSGFISLILGLTSILISMEKEQYESTTTVGTFFLCYFATAIFFGNITFLDQPENEKKSETNGGNIYKKNDKKWIRGPNAVLVF